ncbi:hypothetical protein AJ85_03360 [Alkalihalobacillus alcalophilus ATCC 27647 = CGMCC 1.3604]|uniref:Uncharacterized protein n=1 Tax=Alkalihalobacillus alcalophilus ATCC 27647 = CGMCC 1.3604 TaxID=1218173 RepID=A0A4S4JTK7_ALKAL|nr:hypothetical protein AJ85_03360 [Alkalihalobacillus alcalophilus ATCC 27647 = CGMCC 1.3604]
MFSFKCFITPLIAIFYGYTGISIKHIEEDPGDSIAQNVKEKKMPV